MMALKATMTKTGSTSHQALLFGHFSIRLPLVIDDFRLTIDH
jgi:hypothetical protein